MDNSLEGWGRVKGLGRCWKFKWGWLIVERGLGMVKVLEDVVNLSGEG